MARQQQQRTRTKREDRDRKPRRKVSILDQERIEWVDYKDVNLLRRFMSERAKIRARRVTGNDAQQQRAIARAIRVSREMALIPYSVRQTTHRNKGRGRGDRDDRGTLPMPSGPPPGPSSAEDAPLEFGGEEFTDMAEPESFAPELDAPSSDMSDLAEASVDAETGVEEES